MIALLDPLPSFTETEEVEESTYINGRRTCSKDFLLKVVPAFTPLAPRAPVAFPANKFKASDREIKVLEDRVTAASSTSADMESWIWRKDKHMTVSRDPLIALLRLAYIDTVDYLNQLGWTLDEISRDSLDEFIMTRRLSAWRKLLKDLEIEVPALGHNLRSFLDPDHAAYAEAQVMLDDLDHKRIPEFLDRVRAVHAALRSEMALLDSSRSITEARTMARLTELAFVFIPLTFVSSLFSMQVTELEAGISIWAFVLAAMGLAAFTYATRSLLQSELLRVISQRAKEGLLASGKGSRSQNASAFQVAKYVTALIWQHCLPAVNAMVFVAVSALPIVPIAFMWIQNSLGVGLHAVMTLLVLPPGLAVAYFAACAFEGLARSGDDLGERHEGVRLSFGDRLAMVKARARDKLPRLMTNSSDSESYTSSV